VSCSIRNCRSLLGISSKAMGYGCWCFGMLYKFYIIESYSDKLVSLASLRLNQVSVLHGKSNFSFELFL